MKYKAIVFDMDGTLSDTSPGVFKGVATALARLGRPQVSPERLDSFIGPPLTDSFRRECGMTGEEALEAVTLFREYYFSQGVYESRLYPGMRELLEKLHSAGVILTVATLKQEVMARVLLEKENADHLFSAVAGADPLGVRTKKDTIEIGLIAAGVQTLEGVLMVGDSEYDAIGAQQAGVDFCAARYGFGLTDSIVKRHPCAMEINSPSELWDKLQ